MVAAKKFNTYLIVGVYIFFLFLWAFIRFIFFDSASNDWSIAGASKIWTTNYLIIAILGAFVCFSAYRSIDHKNNKKILLGASLAMLLQALGQAGYSIYLYLYNRSTPYPSIADFFYFGSIFPYIYVGFTLLGYCKSTNFRKIIQFSIWLVVISAIQYLFLRNYEFKFSLALTPIADLAYLSLETLYASAALAAITSSSLFKGGKNRVGLCLISLGLFLQMISEMNFINTARVGSWADGGSGDLLYMSTYFLIGLGASFFLVESLILELLVVILNSFLLIALVYSTSALQYVSNGLTFIVAIVASVLFFKIFKKRKAESDELIRFSALEESHAKLQELDKQKTEFLNIAAHQLRTPVSIIRNYVSMLQDGDFGTVSPEIKPVLDNIYNSNQWLVRLADEFLDISRLESGQTKYNKTAGDIAVLANEVATEIKPKATAKGLQLIFETTPAKIATHFDHEKMRHVILNFLENAIKYTEAGSITARVSVEGDTITFTVTDTGIGFTAEDKQRFFQKFQRGKSAHQIEVNTSSGLGLYICRMFIEGHGGTVFAKSDGPGKGSAFGFIIPYK